MDFSWVTSFQRKITVTQGAQPCQSPHGGVRDIPANWSTTWLPLWFGLHLPRKCYYGSNSKSVLIEGLFGFKNVLTKVWWAELGCPHPQVMVLWNPLQEPPKNTVENHLKYLCAIILEAVEILDAHFLQTWSAVSLWSRGKCLHLQRTWLEPIWGTYRYAEQRHPLTLHGRLSGRSHGTSSKSTLCCLYLDKKTLHQ